MTQLLPINLHSLKSQFFTVIRFNYFFFTFLLYYLFSLVSVGVRARLLPPASSPAPLVSFCSKRPLFWHTYRNTHHATYTHRHVHSAVKWSRLYLLPVYVFDMYTSGSQWYSGRVRVLVDTHTYVHTQAHTHTHTRSQKASCVVHF